MTSLFEGMFKALQSFKYISNLQNDSKQDLAPTYHGVFKEVLIHSINQTHHILEIDCNEKLVVCFQRLPRLSSLSGCSAAWLAHLHGVQEVVGSNPITQILLLSMSCDRSIHLRNPSFFNRVVDCSTREHLSTFILSRLCTICDFLRDSAIIAYKLFPLIGSEPICYPKPSFFSIHCCWVSRNIRQ